MKIICIDNYNPNLPDLKNLLTIGNTYETDTSKSCGIFYLIVNDNGDEMFINKSRFVFMYKIREDKLNQLGI